MTVWNLGSINEDRFYTVPRLPGRGETMGATRMEIGLGGKGANQSVAVARAGGQVRHIGCVGADGLWARDRLAALGVDVSHITIGNVPTGHANVHVDTAGENMIVVYPGANRAIELDRIADALKAARRGDTLLLQNETSFVREAVEMARSAGLFIVYSAAPFDESAARAVIPFVDLLVLNAIEAGQLAEALGCVPEDLPVPHLLITRGPAGATWHDNAEKRACDVAAFAADPVDTTGAGDCFIGYTVAGLEQGLRREEAMRLGAAAAALQIARPGASEAVPGRAEVDKFLAETET